VLKAKGADISANGNDFTGAFNGNATLSETPVFDGQVELDAKNIAALAKEFGQEIKGLSLLDTLKFSADLAGQAKGFKAENIKANITGDDLDGTFTGSGAYGDTLSANGEFSTNIASLSNLLSELDIDTPQAKVLQSLNASGKIALTGETINLTNLTAKTEGTGLEGTFSGNGTFNETLSVDGDFSTNIDSVANLVTALEMDIPQAKAIENLIASGRIVLAGETIRLSNFDAKTAGGIISGTYKGGANLGDIPAFDGNFDVQVSSLSNFAKVTATEIPYADTIGKIAINGTVSGQGENIALPNLTASLSDGQINGRYEGKAIWDKGASLDGRLNIDIPSLRNVAQSTGTVLPPSTANGPIFERFSVNGAVKGTPDNIQFSQATLVFDKINGQGNFGVDMTSAKPFVQGLLDLDGLDLSPYMAAYSAQNPTGEIQPWRGSGW